MEVWDCHLQDFYPISVPMSLDFFAFMHLAGYWGSHRAGSYTN
jgi:hypothetical protein